MKIKSINLFIPVLLLCTIISCKAPQSATLAPSAIPQTYREGKADSLTSGDLSWAAFFKDDNLKRLIDTALVRNSDLQSALQQIEIARAYYSTSRLAFLPNLQLNAGSVTQKESANVSNLATQNPSKAYTDFQLYLSSSWEIDLWGKLNSSRKAAKARFLASQAGAQFVQTQMIAELAKAYYELMAYDEQLSVMEKNLRLQATALEIVKVQKQAGKATDLAVQQFEAQLLNTRAQKCALSRMISGTENYLNLLIGRLPQPIVRSRNITKQEMASTLNNGIPVQLLEHRPDIAGASLMLQAAGFDVQAARKAFYPSLTIDPSFGFAAAKTNLLLNSSSLMWGVTNGLVAPIFQRNQIRGNYKIRVAEQKQALIGYEKVLRQGITEVQDATTKLNILTEEQGHLSKELTVLDNAVNTSHNLYAYGYATYLEVINAQRTVRDAELELINIHKERFFTLIDLYRSLGGGR